MQLDVQGCPPALTTTMACAWCQDWSGKPVLRKVDPALNFRWEHGNVAPSQSDLVSVRWSGALAVTCSGQYSLYFLVDDAVRVQVEGVVVGLDSAEAVTMRRTEHVPLVFSPPCISSRPTTHCLSCEYRPVKPPQVHDNLQFVHGERKITVDLIEGLSIIVIEFVEHFGHAHIHFQ